MSEAGPAIPSNREPPQRNAAAGLDMAPGLRHGLIVFGWLNVGLGVIGVFLPVMPTTVFLLIALWAFSKSSPRFHAWLYGHPRLGPLIHDWHAHRVIPPRAKLLAVTMMAASLAYLTIFVAEGWMLPVAVGGPLGAVAAWIVTRPSRAIPIAQSEDR